MQSMIAGVDEAGRGPLAGPVVAAAVILDPDKPIEGLMDSKKLTEKRREVLFDEIIANATAYSIARAEVEEIDEINILQATLLAMTRAVEQLAIKPDLVQIDGNQAPKLSIKTQTIIKGDQTEACISAASILAKVTRDREMVACDRIYRGYGFASHKGYGTRQHLEALRFLGVTDIHRRSFAPVREMIAIEEGVDG